MHITTAIERALIALVAVMVVAMPAASEPRAPRVAQKVDGERQDARPDTDNMDSEDSRLTARIKIALFADDRIKARWVAVATSSGHVTLSGKVDSADARDAAEAIARAVSGVRTVQNDLQLLAPQQGQTIASRIRPVAEDVPPPWWTKVY